MSVKVLYKTTAKATGGRDGTASTNDGARLVAILALCRITSAGMGTSFDTTLPNFMTTAKRLTLTASRW
jgi:organic hydroperoxide reductase OsmC/OhrA